ncbi:cation-translocating P-type ATPase [Rhizobiaceae bacterium BDR2-2]|uniref:Cation-translocating P-type ATPase n=1 Tax=Ectorhizobium quercum TaxID=2965071 RepID=A0AAE3N3Y5_9HYPH|nr:cation-translocating P-type ATPase [Ectorhizobium quercum]MCX8999791.1 cation-translocating P-type ATPase [Ectorhizobium quercum]
MSCCAPGVEGGLDLERSGQGMPSAEELRLSARPVGEGLLQTDLSVPGVYCGTCITTLEGALGRLPMVERARVNLSSKRVSVVWKDSVDGRPSDPTDIVRQIASTGYESHLFSLAADSSDEQRNQLLRAVAVAGFASANIMLLSVSVWSGAEAATRDLFHWISAGIAAPALVYSGRFFFVSAWQALRRGQTNMDVPISIGVFLSYFVSLWETLNHAQHAWFDATVMLLFFLLIGRTLDHMMRDRARSAITGLARLSPRGAMVIGADGAREYRPVEEIRPGDRLSVAAGDRIAVDGRVLAGESDIDASVVNGESTPVHVMAGDAVQAGMLNLTGSLTVEATAAARDSFLAEMIGLMEAAEGGRARYRRIADRASQYYAPAVHLLAFLSFLGWGFLGGDWKHALLIAVAVLIITCPCALGLAVPVVQVVAAGRLFQNGIMVKDGSAMERLSEIDSVYFDKTGTLTLGRPRLVNRGEAGEAALAIAAGLAGHSRHPLSQALCRTADGVVPSFPNVEEVPGAGVEAVTDEGVYRLGSRLFALGTVEAGGAGEQATSEVVLSLDGAELATFRFEDALRPGAEQVVADLQAQGLSTGILSGDRAPVVEALAGRLGVADWAAALSPRDKAARLAAAGEAGRRTLMVGDGINDAPALSSAHVSIAPATAADVGRQAADFVFLHEGLDAVPLALEVSRKAGRLIRQNFILAIGYNVIAVPIAILGYATPLIAALAMSSSSVIVVVNALRLNRIARVAPPERPSVPETGAVGQGARFAS